MKFRAFLQLSCLFYFLNPIHMECSENPSIDSIQVTEKISFYRVNSSRGNTTTVVFGGSDGVLLVDPNFNQTSKLIHDTISKQFNQPIRYLTSTHVHRDHIEQYGDFTDGATVIIPRAQVKDVLEWGVTSYIAFDNDLTLFFNDSEISLRTFPNRIGHTHGDELIHFVQEKVLYIGDYYFARGYPIVDQHIGDIYGYLANLKFIIDSYPADTVVIPGHSTFHPDKISLISMSDIDRFYNDISKSVDIVKGMHDKGMTLEEILELGLGPELSSYNVDNTFRNEERWIRDVYHYLTSATEK